MKSHLSGFALGFSVPLKGAALLISHPRLLVWAIVPFVTAFFVFVIGTAMGVSALSTWLPMLVAKFVVSGLMYWVTLAFAWPMALAALLYGLYLGARLIAAPFFTLLAQHVLNERGFLKQRPFNFQFWLATNVRMFWVTLVKVLVFAIVGGSLFVLSLFPGLGLLTGFGFLFLIAFDTADAAFEALEMSFRERVAFARSHFAFFSGLSLAVGLALCVPGLNVVLLPAVIAGTADMVRVLLESN